MIFNPIGDDLQTITKTKIFYPVSLSEAKRHLKVEPFFKDDDDLIDDLIIAATGYCEDYIEKDIAKTENLVKVEDYVGEYLKIWEGHFLSNISIVTDTSTLIEPINTYPGYEFVVWELPSFSCDFLNVKFYTGFEENACPSQLKQAVLMKVADFYYVERQSYTPQSYKYNDAIERLLSKYKNTRF